SPYPHFVVVDSVAEEVNVGRRIAGIDGGAALLQIAIRMGFDVPKYGRHCCTISKAALDLSVGDRIPMPPRPQSAASNCDRVHTTKSSGRLSLISSARLTRLTGVPISFPTGLPTVAVEVALAAGWGAGFAAAPAGLLSAGGGSCAGGCDLPSPIARQ